ncbi:D-alanyl-D-alanine carboxypeptidase/D-alanyl-D-alanine-endopeptidase [Desulfatiferula olefinivorans]
MTKILMCVACLFLKTVSSDAGFARLDALIGPDDAVLVMAGSRCLYEKNADRMLIPASTLKVLTALSAFDCLGEGFRYHTDFFLDDQNNLTIKGYGDPLLISEVIARCSAALVPILKKKTGALRNILYDDSFFTSLMVPGAVPHSSEPYDSPNGALCANFNTVNFLRTPEGRLISAEPQTPLLPFLTDVIEASGLDEGRIRLTRHDSRLYAAHLFRFFLEKNGMPVTGDILTAPSPSAEKDAIYTFHSPFSLNDIVSQLLEYSNNFIANQLVLTMGARVQGAPGTLEKGVGVLNRYLLSQGLSDRVVVIEGSGLSRDNRISARDMDRLLNAFASHYFLMKKKDSVYYKTGTLTGISTRVGYVTGPMGIEQRFVVFCNTPGSSSERILQQLIRILNDHAHE